VIARQRDLDQPVLTDVFGKKGLHWLRNLALPLPDALLLTQDLESLDHLNKHIGEMEKRMGEDNARDPAVKRLQSLPGVGPVLAAVMAVEIDGIERFAQADKLCCYAGLVPTTHASGGKVYHGRMLPYANRWLKWAFIEASWVSIGCSDYFGQLYRNHRSRGKKANTAITIVARRMCRIAWQLLHENRDYGKLPPEKKTVRRPTKKLSPAAPYKD
jgi:transposase